MKFAYHELSGCENLILKDEIFLHLIKARRSKIGDELKFYNFKDLKLFSYIVEKIGKKDAFLKLKSFEKIAKPKLKECVAGIGAVEPKNLEKILPMLNELGVKSLGIVKLDYSQGNFKYDEKRMEKILINSSMQCGRFELMELSFFDGLSHWLKKYPNSHFVDFSQNGSKIEEISAFLIGPEGGFSQKEREIFDKNRILTLKTPFILRSETALLSVCAKIFS